MKMRSTTLGLILLVVCGLCLGALAQALSATRPVYPSPADVLAACQKANHDGDARAFVDCYSSQAHKHFLKFLIMMIANSPTTLPTGQVDPEKAAFEAKYGLDHREKRPGETNAQLVDRLDAGVTDPRGCLIDFMTHQFANRPKDRPASPAPELQNIQIDGQGETAVGKLVRHEANGGTMSQNAKFRKSDGSWLLDDIVFF
jgi:hypothetical protein